MNNLKQILHNHLLLEVSKINDFQIKNIVLNAKDMGDIVKAMSLRYGNTIPLYHATTHDKLNLINKNGLKLTKGKNYKSFSDNNNLYFQIGKSDYLSDNRSVLYKWDAPLDFISKFAYADMDNVNIDDQILKNLGVDINNLDTDTLDFIKYFVWNNMSFDGMELLIMDTNGASDFPKINAKRINELKEYIDSDHIKSFSDVNESNIDELLSIYGEAGFNDIEERNEWLLDRVNSIYPWGYKNIPNKLKLYRIVKLDNPKQLNMNKVGKHYVNDKDLLTDDEFIQSIGLSTNDKDKFYIIEVEANKNDIDVLTTMVQNILNPQEEEWYLKSNPKVVGIEKLIKNKKSNLKESEDLIKKYNIGFGMLVKFRGDNREYTIKNVSPDRKRVFVTLNNMQTYSKKISDIVSLNRRSVINENNSNNNLNNNFKKWFSGSKVIDKSGNPLPVYHGSREEFEGFIGDTYFTPDYMNADGYAGGEYVYEVYLNLKNPLIVDCQDKKWDNLDTPYGTTTQGVVSNVNRNKYDGVIFINIKDSWIDDEDYQDSDTVYVTFKPTQIKSTENDGSWDINDKNIYS